MNIIGLDEPTSIAQFTCIRTAKFTCIGTAKSRVQSVEFALISIVVEPTHSRDFRDCTVSFSPTDVNQKVYGAPDVRHDRPVR